MEQVVDPIAQATMEGNEFSLLETKGILKSLLKKTPSIPDDDENVRKLVVLIGAPGEGKTAILHESIDELGHEKCVFHMGSTVEEDNNGLPFIDQAAGITRIAKPEHIPCFTREPSSPTGKGVLVVEECLSGQIMHQNFLRSIVDRVWPNGDKMLPGWSVVGTTNPETSEYITVKAADRALASRMYFIFVKSTADERLAFWSGRMQETVYNFLLLHHTSADTFDPASRLDSRAWYGIADSIERLKADSHDNNTVAKSLRTHCGPEVETRFREFLTRGNDPDQYPISHAKLLLGDEDEVNESISRLGRWIKDNQTPLLGATKWDIKAYLTKQSNLEKIKNDPKLYDTVVTNLCKYLVEACSNGTAEHADDVCSALMKAASKVDSRIIRDVLNGVKGTPAEKELINMNREYKAAKQKLNPAAA